MGVSFATGVVATDGGGSYTPPTSITGKSISVDSVVSLSALVDTDLINNQEIWLQNYWSTQPGGGGQIVYSSTSTATVDNGSVFPTASGVGRFLRQFSLKNYGIYNPRDWGAKGDYAPSTDTGTNDQTAFDNCIAYARANKPFSNGTVQGISWVHSPGGSYLVDGLKVGYVDVAFFGDGLGLTRIYQSSTITTKRPIIYLTAPLTATSSASRTIAIPFGGCYGMSLYANTKTHPAKLYSDVTFDQGFKTDGLGFGIRSGTTALCDDISAFDYLNWGTTGNRFDSSAKWSIRFRASENNISVLDSSSGHYRINGLTIGTGEFTTTLSNEPVIGTPIILMGKTTPVAPTAVDTGLALDLNNVGTVYYIALGSRCDYPTPNTRIFLARTYADAIAGTNIITFSVTYSGVLAFCLFPAWATITATAAEDTITYDNGGRGFLIPTACYDTGLASSVVGNYDNPLTMANGTSAIWFYSDGALPSPLVQGTTYWGIYQDAETINVATSAQNASNGTFIDITSSGSGNMIVMMNRNCSIFGLGHCVIKDFTWDNASAPTSFTTGSTARGGYGFLSANYSSLGSDKGVIEVSSSRLELNKALAYDLSLGAVDPSFIRLTHNVNQASTDGANITLISDGISVDVSATGSLSLLSRDVQFLTNGSQFQDSSFSITNFSNFGMGAIYNNRSGTASSGMAGRGGSAKARLGAANSRRNPNRRQDGVMRNMIDGIAIGQQDSTLTSAYAKQGDIFYGGLGGIGFYKAIQSTIGQCKGTTGTPTSIGATVDMTSGSNVCTYTGTLAVNFSKGTSVTVAGAGAASATLIGVVGEIDAYSSTKKFKLYDNNGVALNASTTVAAAICNYADAIFAIGRVYYTVSAALDFGSIAAGTSAELTIAAPTGVTFTAGKPCIVGAPSNISSNTTLNPFAYVTSGGATVTVRLTNNALVTAVDPASGTYTVDIAV